MEIILDIWHNQSEKIFIDEILRVTNMKKTTSVFLFAVLALLYLHSTST